MNFPEYQSLLAAGISIGVDPSLTVKASMDRCAVNGFIAKQLTTVSPQYPRSSEIEIRLGTGTGTAFLLTSKGTAFDFNEASSLWAAAYLEEQSVLGATTDPGAFRFEKDYLIIHELVTTHYENHYQKGSAVWGGFTHPREQHDPLRVFDSRSFIQATANINLPTIEHEESALRAATQPSALDRYLSLYHLLELSFDYDLVQQIKLLDQDLKGVGKLLNSYSQSEFDRLNRLIKKYCTDKTHLGSLLNQAFSLANHRIKLEELLFDYSKDSNPFKDKRSELTITSALGFTEANFKANKIDWNSIEKFVSYIIYRFRCSIAHASIGEFILGSSDESFVAEVAEPLIKGVLCRVYLRNS